MNNTDHNIQEEFKKDVQMGFSTVHKFIPSKYFYDDRGSQLFNEITHHPDYYLTNCEIEILDANKFQISKILDREAFNLVELGPGEGIKTQILIKQFLNDSLEFSYFPIDISAEYLKKLSKQLSESLPKLDVTAIHSDYFKGLKWLNLTSERRNVVLFFGSSIGNFVPEQTLEFLQHLSAVLHKGDYVLIGFDLRKEMDILMRAYNDTHGITREFNLNLFYRMNRELGANFIVDKFRHYESYNVYTGAMESYLVSLEEQIISMDALSHSFLFQAFEPIQVEYSYKYLPIQIEAMSRLAGFEIVQNFTDSRNYFVDSLWRVK